MDNEEDPTASLARMEARRTGRFNWTWRHKWPCLITLALAVVFAYVSASPAPTARSQNPQPHTQGQLSRLSGQELETAKDQLQVQIRDLTRMARAASNSELEPAIREYAKDKPILIQYFNWFQAKGYPATQADSRGYIDAFFLDAVPK